MFHRVYLEYPQPTTFTFIFSLHRIPSTYFCSHHTNYFSYNTITLVHYFCLTVLSPSLLTPGVCNSFFEIPWVGLLWKYWHESSRDRTRDCDNMDSAKNSEAKIMYICQAVYQQILTITLIDIELHRFCSKWKYSKWPNLANHTFIIRANMIQ